MTGKKIILFGAGIIGRRALNFFGSDRVYCFADNNKAGKTFWDKPVISFDELTRICGDYDVVISISIGTIEGVVEQCQSSGVRYSVFGDLISCEDFESNPEIREFKDRHAGERCFLVGNGPSLRAEDLTTLHNHNVLTFGCNAISKIYNQTPWRVNYFVVSDASTIAHQCDMLVDSYADCKFIPVIEDNYCGDEKTLRELFGRKGGKVLYFRMISFSGVHDEVPFSSDVSKAVYSCGTVMYIMIQIAVYMGFTHIYLLGVDGNHINMKYPDEYLSEKRHFYDDDINIVHLVSNHTMHPSPEVTTALSDRAYKKAEAYTREHGIKIFNATRGGRLEMFERVNFDSLFEKEAANND